jgi:hypothetical protein
LLLHRIPSAGDHCSDGAGPVHTIKFTFSAESKQNECIANIPRGALGRSGKTRSGPAEGAQAGHRCFQALVSGQTRSVAELARVEGVSDRYLSSLLPLAFLAPDIVEAIASGRQPADLTAHHLIRTLDLPIARTRRLVVHQTRRAAWPIRANG